MCPRLAARVPPAQEPPENASNAHHQDSHRVPDKGLSLRRRWQRGRGPLRHHGHDRGEMRPTAPSSLALVEVVGQQRRPLGGRARRMAVGRISSWGWGRRGCGVITPSETLVVEALPQQHEVGNGVVDGEDEHRRQDALEDGAEDVEDIAQQPDDDELDREAVGRVSSEVFYYLGREDDNPGGNRYRAGQTSLKLVERQASCHTACVRGALGPRMLCVLKDS